jgi:hypothetical protein
VCADCSPNGNHPDRSAGALPGEQAPEGLSKQSDQQQIDRTEHGRENDEVGGHPQHLGQGGQHVDQLETQRPLPALDVGRTRAVR